MKKWFPILVITLILTLAFAGMAAAAITEEPLELGEGEMGITAVTEEPIVLREDEVAITSVEDEPVSNLDDISRTTTIPGIDGQEVEFEGTPEEASQVRTLGSGIDNLQPAAASKNVLPYVTAGAAVMLAALFALRKKAFAGR